MKVTVCIPTIRPDTVADAIASIRAQRFPDWDLLIIGQGDEHAIRPVVEAAAGDDLRVRYLHIARSGLSIARNHALREATGDIVVFTDDDCEASPDWLDRVVAVFDRHPEVGLVFGSLVAPQPAPIRFRVCPQFTARELLYDPVASGGHAPEGWSAVGANFSVRREQAARIGDFDEHLGAGARFPAAEDTDYMLRAELLGVPMYSSPTLVVNHTNGFRYGLSAVYRHRRAYALGNGALAAKLTHLGDARGRAWMRSEVDAATVEPFRNRAVHTIPVHMLRLMYFAYAYRTCLRKFRTEPVTVREEIVRATLSNAHKAA
jgi:glycosyltransferase involved in cell wall biosynthesis